jgi:hypothetical protein
LIKENTQARDLMASFFLYFYDGQVRGQLARHVAQIEIKGKDYERGLVGRLKPCGVQGK